MMQDLRFYGVVWALAVAATLCSVTAATAAVENPAWHSEVKLHAKGENTPGIGKARSATQLVTDPGFDALSPAQQTRLLISSAHERIVPGPMFDLIHAHAVLLRALELEPEEPEALYLLVLVQMDRGLYADAANTLTRLGRLYPQLLPAIDEAVLPPLLTLVEHDAPQRLELMRMLHEEDWNNRLLDASPYWYEMALALVRAGDIDTARTVVARIESPRETILMRADRRFDALVDREAPDFDPVAIAQRHIDQRRVHAVLEEQRLDLLLGLGNASLMAGEYESVLAMTDKALQIIRAPNDWDEPFPDIGSMLPWLLNLRASALFGMERDAEAFASLHEASLLLEDGHRNTSHVLNLAMWLAWHGRGEDAMQALAHVGRMSPYGLVMHQLTALIVAVDSGDADAVATLVESIWDEREVSPMAAADALLLAGLHDRTAAWLIDQLEDEQGRGKALLWSQDFDHVRALPLTLRYLEQREAVLSRPDVAAALTRVGRRERHALPDVGSAY